MPSDEFLAKLEAEIPRLRRYAYSLTASRAEADDLVQDCLCRAIEKSALWAPGSNLRAWLFTILRNLFLSKIRHGKRMSESDLRNSRLADEVSSSQQYDSLFFAEVKKALDSLPYEQREVILLVGIEGMKYDEVADVIGLPIGTVRSRLSRAREALRAATSATGGDSFC